MPVTSPVRIDIIYFSKLQSIGDGYFNEFMMFSVSETFAVPAKGVGVVTTDGSAGVGLHLVDRSGPRALGRFPRWEGAFAERGQSLARSRRAARRCQNDLGSTAQVGGCSGSVSAGCQVCELLFSKQPRRDATQSPGVQESSQVQGLECDSTHGVAPSPGWWPATFRA